jgi:NADPH-dependent 2,4-dienoyl-CoA reductase/sulfur reductase-like enzyme
VAERSGRRYEVVVCGGGPAGHAAVRAYRDAGGAGAVLLASADDRLPYARPPLSKGYLRGETDAGELPLDDAAWYREHDVDVALDMPARGFDPVARRVLLGGEAATYGTLILATGAEPAALPVPGGDDAAILRLRRPADSDRIRAAGEAGSVTVVGSGFIGCEAAASLALRGTRVRIVGEEDLPQQSLLGDDAGERIAAWLRELGVELVLGARVERIRDGRTVVVEGGRELAADAVVLGAGIVPNTAIAAAAGLELEQERIPCDPAMRTAADGVLAAGDAALAMNDAAGRRLVVQHWGEAERMGEVAGRTAAGTADAWAQAPGFWSEIGTNTVKHVAWGDGHDATRLLDGPGPDAFAVLYGRDGTLVGVLTSGLDEVYERGRSLVEGGATLAAAADQLAQVTTASR